MLYRCTHMTTVGDEGLINPVAGWGYRALMRPSCSVHQLILIDHPAAIDQSVEMTDQTGVQ